MMDAWSILATFVIVVVNQSVARSQDVDATIELNFMFITSKNRLFDSSGSRVAVDMALERINHEDSSFVSGYRLSRTEDLDSNVCTLRTLNVQSQNM